MPLDPLTIIAAVVALLVLWKLKSVLGERTGLEKPPTNPFADPQASSQPPSPRGGPSRDVGTRTAEVPRDPTNPARWAPFAEPGSSVAQGLDAIVAADPSFAPGPFLDGAKIAYETVITAFAAGDRDSLKNLLAPDVYDSFVSVVDARLGRRETMMTTFVSLDDAKLVSAAFDGKAARLGVRFTSKQISETHDSDGKLVDGNPDRVLDMNDIWTFARDVTSRDPNWKLVATQSGG